MVYYTPKAREKVSSARNESNGGKKMIYRCEGCGATFSEEQDECPKCGCGEVYEVEDGTLSTDEVFELVDSGVIPAV